MPRVDARYGVANGVSKARITVGDPIPPITVCQTGLRGRARLVH